MEERTPNTFGGYSMAEWIGAGALLVVILFCLALCSGQSESSSSTSSTDTDALVACKRYAKNKYPYGFDYSLMDTSITEISGKTRVVFQDAKIGNVYGAERTVTVHCDVSGGTVVGFSAL